MSKECILDNVFDRDSVGCELQCMQGYDCNYHQEKRTPDFCQCEECKKGTLHRSDCAVHNEPAEPNGECNCL